MSLLDQCSRILLTHRLHKSSTKHIHTQARLLTHTRTHTLPRQTLVVWLEMSKLSSVFSWQERGFALSRSFPLSSFFSVRIGMTWLTNGSKNHPSILVLYKIVLFSTSQWTVEAFYKDISVSLGKCQFSISFWILGIKTQNSKSNLFY